MTAEWGIRTHKVAYMDFLDEFSSRLQLALDNPSNYNHKDFKYSFRRSTARVKVLYLGLELETEFESRFESDLTILLGSYVY